MPQAKLILIAGPTASGKSALALDLARKMSGTIINADAMQVYAGLPILTAQPDMAEQKEIPHLLYGALDPMEQSSVGKWLALAHTAIDHVIAGKRTPILVGGTGLYFSALLGGLAEIPEIPPSMRGEAEKLYEELGEDKFRAALAKLDPESAAKLARNDRQRSIRAYAVVSHTAKPIGDWHKRTVGKDLRDFEIESHLLMPPREALYAACDKRFEQMIKRGALDEVKAFLKLGLVPSLPSMKTIGVREIGAYLSGEITLEQAIMKAQQGTRNYAKRQMTWFRNQWK